MGRPRTPLLQPSLVVRAALRIIDNDGLDGLSVRRLADELGVQVASLYHRYENKEAILFQVCQQVVLDLDPPDEAISDWGDLVVRMATDFRRSVLRHPKLIPVMTRYSADMLVPELSSAFVTLLRERGMPSEWVAPIREAFDVLAHGSLTMHFVHMQNGDRKGLRAAAPMRRADAAFEFQCRIVVEGFRAAIAAGVAVPGTVRGNGTRRS